MKKSPVPFPFLGQGDAEYYAWIEIAVEYVGERNVPPTVRKLAKRD